MIKVSKFLTPKSKENYISLMKEILDVFAWNYEYIKVYDTNIIQHTILVKEGEKPFKQKLRRMNPFLPFIEKEIKKLFDANISVFEIFQKVG